MSEKQTECSHTNEPSKAVTGNSAVGKNFKADICQKNDYSDTAYKAENLPCMGKNEVVVKFGYVDIFISACEKSLAENSPDCKA